MFALSKVRQSRNRKRICCPDLADGHQGSALCLCMGCFHVQTGLFEGSYLKISLASAAVWLAASGFGHAEVDRQACMAARTDSEVLTPLNGERLNCGAMTAAHRTLPLGTLVQVCHNGCVVVRINDRGLFVRVRRFDPCLPQSRKRPLAGASLNSAQFRPQRISHHRATAPAIACCTPANGFDFSDRFPLVVEAIAALPARACVVDGEGIVVDDCGDLIRYQRQDHAVTLCAFDLLELKARICGGRLSTAVDDGRRLVGGELPSAVLPQPDCEIAIVDVNDSLAGDRYLSRHPSGQERGSINDQNAVGRMGDF